MTPEVLLSAIEAEIQRQTATLSGDMLEVCRYAMQGGQRSRAALLLGAAQGRGIRELRAATALEMLHAATLLQDDIFDSGQVRRGQTAAHLRYGRAKTILASDWLLIRALELAAETDPSFFCSLAHAGKAMAQAEALELHPPQSHSLAEAKEQEMEVSEGKTALLFGSALCGAAVLRGLPVAERRVWEDVGLRMGMTYQFVDDCTDLYSTESEARKDVGTDLPAGRLTLPVLFALEALAKQGFAFAPEGLRHTPLDEGCRSSLHTMLHSSENKQLVRACLQRRLEVHRLEAGRVGIDELTVQRWLSALWDRADRCLVCAEDRDLAIGSKSRLEVGDRFFYA